MFPICLLTEGRKFILLRVVQQAVTESTESSLIEVAMKREWDLLSLRSLERMVGKSCNTLSRTWDGHNYLMKSKV